MNRFIISGVSKNNLYAVVVLTVLEVFKKKLVRRNTAEMSKKLDRLHLLYRCGLMPRQLSRIKNAFERVFFTIESKTIPPVFGLIVASYFANEFMKHTRGNRQAAWLDFCRFVEAHPDYREFIAGNNDQVPEAADEFYEYIKTVVQEVL